MPQLSALRLSLSATLSLFFSVSFPSVALPRPRSRFQRRCWIVGSPRGPGTPNSSCCCSSLMTSAQGTENPTPAIQLHARPTDLRDERWEVTFAHCDLDNWLTRSPICQPNHSDGGVSLGRKMRAKRTGWSRASDVSLSLSGGETSFRV